MKFNFIISANKYHYLIYKTNKLLQIKLNFFSCKFIKFQLKYCHFFIIEYKH